MTRKAVPLLIGGAMLMVATQTPAQDAPGRVLQKSNLRAFTSILSGQVTVGTSFVRLLTPTVVNCPGTTTCTLHIEVSTDINSLDAGARARMRVELDDAAVAPGVGFITVATNDGAAATGVNTKTFQFLATGVQPGNHTVEWLASVTSGTAVAINRIQKVNIYTP